MAAGRIDGTVRRRGRTVRLAAIVAATVLAITAPVASAASSGSGSTAASSGSGSTAASSGSGGTAASSGSGSTAAGGGGSGTAQPAVPAGLPDDGPPALYRPAPTLPVPQGWPAPDVFPATSGTGRYDAGAFYWSDFLYDDTGALGAPTGRTGALAAPPRGGYGYPAGAAHGDGADIFRAAIALRPDATYWRVDWLTLADPSVPIAEWTFDTDDDTATGGSAWPAGAGVRSAGIDEALVVSAHGARLLAVPSGRVLATLPVTVDRDTGSFVVRAPRSVLPVAGTWRVRLAAGLADAAGTGFAPATGALPGQPAVYNVTFRSTAQEAQGSTLLGANFWNEDAQATALATGDVSQFGERIHWADLAGRRVTAPARPTGWSVRWYVSSVQPGLGVDTGANPSSSGAVYLGRVQPYAVYVPTGYDPARPAPLTFLLHSLTQNHNQYAATTPDFVRLACQDRHSICVSPLGRGPGGMYQGTAQLDFWEVWNRVAAAYRLDPDRTVLAGYSMGGLGTNDLATAHPDLFAKAVTLAGAVGDVPELASLRWVPVYLAGGLADELVPVTVEKAEADALDALGYRYRWELYPAEDHVAFELQDSFADAAAFMAGAVRTRHPDRITYRWRPQGSAPSPSPVTGGGYFGQTQDPALGIVVTGAYWLRDLTARPGATDASVDATSGLLAGPAPVAVRSRSVDPTAKPEPALVTQLTWTAGATPPRRPVLTMDLTGISALAVRLADAGFAPGTAGTLRVSSDGPVTIRLGSRTVHLAGGTHTVTFTG